MLEVRRAGAASIKSRLQKGPQEEELRMKRAWGGAALGYIEGRVLRQRPGQSSAEDIKVPKNK